MTAQPITVNIDTENEYCDHIQISTAGIGIKSRNDKILVTAHGDGIWITAIDYDGKSSAVEIDDATLSELIKKVQKHILMG